MVYDLYRCKQYVLRAVTEVRAEPACSPPAVCIVAVFIYLEIEEMEVFYN